MSQLKFEKQLIETKSLTNIYFIKDKNKILYVVKVYPQVIPNYETHIYKITNKILKNNHSRNFVKYISQNSEIALYFKQYLNNDFIITEYIMGQSFKNWFENILHEIIKTNSEKFVCYIFDIYQMLFQIYYSIMVLGKHEITHNDLHLKNILIDKSSKQHIACYKTLHHNVYIDNNNGIPKIFDYDRATLKNYPNTLNKPQIGQSNIFNKYRDFVKFSCYILKLINTTCEEITSHQIKKTYLLHLKNWILECIAKNDAKNLESILMISASNKCFFKNSDMDIFNKSKNILLNDIWLKSNINTPEKIIDCMGQKITNITIYNEKNFKFQKNYKKYIYTPQ